MNNLVAIGSEQAEAEAHVDSTRTPSEELALEPEWADQPPGAPDEAQGSATSRLDWVAPTLAGLAILGWTAFFVFAQWNGIRAPATPQQWTVLISSWAVPVVLVVALWLLAMRNSRREATRFADAAQALSFESARLEKRLVTVNRELSLAREFIASQARDLESLGRIAGERLSQHADRLQVLIRNNGEEVEAIGRVSSTALDNMNRLRHDLPVVSSSARDVANQIGSVGRAAQEQLDHMAAGFRSLDESRQASEQKVGQLRAQVENALTAFQAQAAQLEEIAEVRFAALAERSQAFRGELGEQETAALASIRRRADVLSEELAARSAELTEQEDMALSAVRDRITEVSADGERLASALELAQGEAAERWRAAVARLEERMNSAIQQVSEVDSAALESARRRLSALSEEARRLDEALAERTANFEGEIARRRTEIERQETESLVRVEERFGLLDAQISDREQQYLEHVAGLAERGEALARQLAEFSTEMERAVSQGDEAGARLAQAVGALATKLGESRHALNGTGELVSRLTEESTRLLELIRASAQHAGEELPEAVARAEERLSGFDQCAAGVEERVVLAGEKSEALVGQIGTARREANETLQQLEVLHERLAQNDSAHAERLAALHRSIAELNEESEALTGRAHGELQSAVSVLEEAARGVLANIENQQAKAIGTLARRIAGDAAQALDSAVREKAGGAIGELEEAAERARQASSEAALQLASQLEKVNELAGNLERRVTQARQRAEEQVDHDFARRMALITDRLNSSAVDIGKALSSEVADTAWASYLRGDRGIFTRRAVRLLDSKEARQVTEVYEEDSDFRETVNRYIRDFEAMLRSILSTRDGNILAVTLLSSDMGKLYVALAQAINRLRE